ncbi:CrcB family protein [Streptomyces sp. AJS327]|uniref:FluC/FEX family fluoride channel n=1 Tax=Streptomyces sp. AJS327 TaxID=2545265 RepID=UPI0027E435A8|nr:CrcB family protein [Streptomyces sp. AJS327]
MVAAVALGGGAGAGTRYATGLLWPVSPGGFPWSTLCVNVLGGALIGLFMALSAEFGTAGALLRPFVVTGFLGGFTTLSTVAAELHALGDGQPYGIALHDVGQLGYFVLTPVAVLLAASTAAWTTERAVRRQSGAGAGPRDAHGDGPGGGPRGGRRSGGEGERREGST